jgi:uncharacterized protein YjbI with pentapeptide repeats
MASDLGDRPGVGAPGDVFPTLGRSLAAGLLMGLALGAGMAWSSGLGGRGVAGLGAGAAFVGAILGAFIGLSHAVWRPGLPLAIAAPIAAPAAEPEARLWDPWVDMGDEVIPEPPSAPPAAPEVAPPGDRPRVQPRVASPSSGEAVLLHDEIGALIERGAVGAVAVVGGLGSGKTTALRHLEAVLPPWADVKLVDEPGSPDEVVLLAHDRLVVFTACGQKLPQGVIATYRLAPWSRDDRIEYLLKAHWSRCASVMERLKGADDGGILGGVPELWALVLERMAMDRSVSDVRAVLRREVDDRSGGVAVRDGVSVLCLEAVRRGRVLGPAELPGEVDDLVRLVRHPTLQLLMAADRLAADVASGRHGKALAHALPPGLVSECGRVMADSPAAIRELRRLLVDDNRNHDPMASSLLHAAGVVWRPAPPRRAYLQGAYLAGARWIGVDLEAVDLTRADLEGADLWRAKLIQARASFTRLVGAQLREADLTLCDASFAEFTGATMSRVRADGGRFKQTRFAHADLSDSSFRETDLTGAVLAGARFRGANLWKARLDGADVEGADFTGANLEDAGLNGLKLRLARLDGARFGGADLSGCDLEGVALESPDFHDAVLTGALMTGSVMPGANFLGADLREAGLARIDWPGACLRDAALDGASFHLGTTRSGLVGSTVPCEGSRTGFYTDDYDERDYKSPEEIRAANLRGADLRGAEVGSVDFYLVDLRDARYTRSQAEHFHRCGAILDDRAR